MPCPHYSRENGDCRLLQEPPPQEEERVLVSCDKLLSRDWCLASGKGHRDCPVFRRYLIEIVP